MSNLVSLQLTIFLLVFIGFFIKKIHLVSEEGQECLNDLIIYVVLPCNILKAFMVEFSVELLQECLGIFLISVGVQVFAVIYSKIVYRKESESHRKCLSYGIICSNAGFLGNPVAEGVFGSTGLVLASVFLIPMRIMMWSEGIAVFSGNTNRRATFRKVVTHPCILACFAGLFLMLSQIKLPDFLMETVTVLGNCNTALCMLVIGMILAKVDLKTLLDKTVIKYTFRRLVLIPGYVFLVCMFLPVDHMVTGVAVLLCAMPAGATTSILASKYDMEPEFATKLVIFSTLLSLPTSFLWSTILT